VTKVEIRWPKIIYRAIGLNLIACVEDNGRLRDVYPIPARRYDWPREFPGEAFQRLYTYARETRRNLERLVVYCPAHRGRPCVVLKVFSVDGWLLLKLSGERLIKAGYSNIRMQCADKPWADAYLKYQPVWLTQPPTSAYWRLGCRHGGPYLVDSFSVYDAACSAHAADRVRVVALTTLTLSRTRV